MAFSDFKTISEVLEKFRITYSERFCGNWWKLMSSFRTIFGRIWVLHVTSWYLYCWAARCEAIIFPILKEVYKPYAKDYALWIKKAISYDETLNGTPDYLIATRSELGIPVVGIPLIILVEAKKNDFDMGWGQCIAELLAAQKINGAPDILVYGIVSDGTNWEFGLLDSDAFTRNRISVSMHNLPQLFGTIDTVFKAGCNGHHTNITQENSFT